MIPFKEREIFNERSSRCEKKCSGIQSGIKSQTTKLKPDKNQNKIFRKISYEKNNNKKTKAHETREFYYQNQNERNLNCAATLRFQLNHFLFLNAEENKKQ